MSDLEKMLKKCGAVLVKIGKHKIYELNGKRYTLHHGRIGSDRGPQRDDLRKLKRRLDDQRNPTKGET